MTYFCGGVDLSGYRVVLLGNGPSAWGVDASTVQQLQKRGMVVAGCNKAGMEMPCDFVFAVDREMVWMLLRDKHYQQKPMVVPGDRFRHWISSGNTPPADLEPGFNYFAMADMATGVSTGVAAFECLLNARAQEVWLVGFDGSHDNRNRYTGTEGYRREPSDKALFSKWENQMVNIANHLKEARGLQTRFVLVLDHDDPHPLDRLSPARVRAESLLTEATLACPAD